MRHLIFIYWRNKIEKAGIQIVNWYEKAVASTAYHVAITKDMKLILKWAINII